MRIDVTGTKRVAEGVFDQHYLAGLELRDWRGLGVDFIAENPHMAGAQATVFVLEQA
ncbi:MAG TPA: hypothetical protein VES91_01950 [Burkholderiaceae bacterium]|nr:hypothetical protein [Burkholderiaceae bacterium]